MKLIHLIVASCKECPYIHIINDCVYYCTLGKDTYAVLGVDHQGQLYDGKTPVWCELPDNYEQEDDGEIN